MPVVSAALPGLDSAASRNVARFPVAIPQAALGTVQSSYNTLLAELRTAGIISP